VKLLVLETDTVAVISKSEITHINEQLKVARIESLKISQLRGSILTHQAMIDKLTAELNKKDSLYQVELSYRSKSDWDYIRAVNRYERAEKRTRKYKNMVVGIGAASITIISMLVTLIK